MTNIIMEMSSESVLALAQYLQHSRRRNPDTETPALAEAIAVVDREAVAIIHGDRVERREVLPPPLFLYGVNGVAEIPGVTRG